MIRAWWNTLLAREQRVIIAAGFFVIFLLAYVFFWSPLMGAVERSEHVFKQEKARLVWMQHAVKRIDVYRKKGLLISHLQHVGLVLAVDNALKKERLSAYISARTVQGGKQPSAILLNFNSVPFDRLIHMVQVLWRDQGVYVSLLKLSRLPTQGLVRVALTLKSID